MFELGRARQWGDERVDQFRSRVEGLVEKAYRHLTARDREPMAVNAFMVGLLDGRLVEHLLTQKPESLAEAERVSQEYIQIKRSVPDGRGKSRDRPVMVSGSVDDSAIDSPRSAYAEAE